MLLKQVVLRRGLNRLQMRPIDSRLRAMRIYREARSSSLEEVRERLVHDWSDGSTVASQYAGLSGCVLKELLHALPVAHPVMRPGMAPR